MNATQYEALRSLVDGCGVCDVMVHIGDITGRHAVGHWNAAESARYRAESDLIYEWARLLRARRYERGE